MWIIIDHRGEIASQDCGPISHHNGKSGSFSSPNYPNNYANYENCLYPINVTTGHKVCVIINDFAGEECCDYLAFYDGQITSPVLERYM
ncbi:hypothetical protein DPMN_103683 [Dreissena polymorpha]|uniref:CUB domain-containing protein n=1 Tax=Dreissena polymorpha TaxID=45954 RepID=A0A9D4H6G2_DREPO|nr:hypothetical protein DPMN_103683 [Dreissena polymorpha]